METSTTVASAERRAGGDRRAARNRRIAQRSFPPTLEAASDARRYTNEVLGAWGVAVREDAVLVAAELAANAVRHAASPFVLSLSLYGDRPLYGDRLRVAVHDDDPTPPHPLEETSAATGGRGLLIVRRLATSWGWEAGRGGKTVWATVPVPARPYPVMCVPPAIA